jgi:microcystin-dependent protein
MSRNGSGVYAVVNTFVAGNTITAGSHNANWSDIAAEMTNSVAADGQTTMTGPLKAASGTVGAPGVTFASDPDCGLYRIGANNIGVAVNGAKVIDVATTGASVTGTLAASGVISQGGFALLPVGLGPLPWSGTAAPAGWLLCYGQSLSRTTYAALWAHAETEIGLGNTLFTNGNGSTTFTIADMRGRVPAGWDSAGGSSANRLTNADDGLNGDTLGATGGGETQTLVTGNLPAYTPAGSVSISGLAQKTRKFNPAGFSVSDDTSLSTGSNTGNLVDPNGQPFVSGTASFTGTAQGGASTAFGIVQPTIITNYIIFAGV